MLTVNGQKMSKSLGNSFLPAELFSGDHPLLDKGYSSSTVRFFMLQSHYSSTLDFSNEALQAAEKGYKKLSNALKLIKTLDHSGTKTIQEDLEKDLERLIKECYSTMGDDFNTARTLAVLFEMASRINDFKSGNIQLHQVKMDTFLEFQKTYISFMEEILGLQEEATQNDQLLNNVIQVLIELRKKARQDRNYTLSDKIRDDLKQAGVQLMDGKDGEMSYTLES
jgi:cysteinyl-tRNA synthetase